jgi:fermentation-respiration switch protein FrsA (DUF1100 family)
LVCTAYVVSLLLFLALEDRLLYPGATFDHRWEEPPACFQVRALTLHSATDDNIYAWFSVPKGWQPSKGAVLISHGNGINLSRTSALAWLWREALGQAVLLYDYPGYGKSSGRPSESRCYAAGEAAWKWLRLDQGVAEREVILVGDSLGGAIAVELACRHPARLLVLHGAFTSVPDMAQRRFPWYPARYLVHNQMDNESKIGLVQCPVLLTHGTDDSVVPFYQGERLFAAAREPKQFFPLEGRGHGPPSEEDFFDRLRDFLIRITRNE